MLLPKVSRNTKNNKNIFKILNMPSSYAENAINFFQTWCTCLVCHTSQWEKYLPYPRSVLFILYMYAFGISHTYGNDLLLSSTIDHPQDDPKYMQMYANRHVQCLLYQTYALFTSITSTSTLSMLSQLLSF